MHILEGYLAELERGVPPDPAQLLARHPELAEPLKEYLASLEFLHRAALSLRGGPAPDPGPGACLADLGRLGDFQLVREVGRGGMGVVYEAVQISLGRRVALKVLPFASTLDPRQLQRFQNEARAASPLHHPGIVPVYATGCERGVHYFAMQLIDGQTLAHFIRDLRQHAGLGGGETGAAAAAPTRAVRSTEFSTGGPAFFRAAAGFGVQAARALEHAHQMGVVHRDVKPANLLLEGEPGVSAPGVRLWVTDFGLAHCRGLAGPTMTGDLVGTLRYMSPEQALARRVAVDHRTDVYSLGATLYELLTLEPAFDGRDREELLRQIAFDEPRPPRRLRPAIPVELETIVGKAMEKDPAERFGTAGELADDLERFLNDEPIRATRPTPVQRARRWARRHRPVVWSAAAALLVTLAVLAGAVGWVVRDREDRQARTAAAAQAALDEARQFQREGKFLQGQAAAERAQALLAGGEGAAELRQAVDEVLADFRMVARVEDVGLLRSGVADGRFDFAGGDRGYAAAFRDYGIDVEALDPRTAAEPVAARTIRVELAAALDGWAETRRAVLPRGGKSWQDLLAVARAADPDPQRMALRDAVLRGDRRALAERAAYLAERAAAEEVRGLPPVTLVLLAESLRAMGALAEATALLRRAQPQHPGDFWISHHLGSYCDRMRPPDRAGAIAFYTAAVALRPDSPGARLNLGKVLADGGRLDEAVAACRRALELKPGYAEAYNNLGRALHQKGALDEAVAAYRRAIDLKPHLAAPHQNLGVALHKKGRLDEAVAAYRRALALEPDNVQTLNNLGSALADQGEFDGAAAASRQAIGLRRDDPEPYNTLGRALDGQGRLDEALAAYRQAIRLKPAYAEAHCNLGVALGRKGRFDDEIAAYRRAVGLKPGLAQAHFNLGRALADQGRLDEAAAAYRRVLDLEPARAEAHYDLGNLLQEQGRLDEAVAAYRRALALRPAYAEAYCNLGSALRQRGEFAPALAAFTRGHELGSRDPDWPYPSARWVAECRRLGELAGRLPAVLRGEARPTDAAEAGALALLCHDQGRYAAAARLWADALASDPKRADDLEAGCRHDAACAAALAAAGRGADAGRLGDAERVRWRQQALGWLRADLAAYGRLLEGGRARDSRRVRQRLRGWQGDPDLAGLRDPAALARLPDGEREACRRLWAEVQALLTRAEAAEPRGR
jgi:tetratricopeptide (TPR) repeat protein